MTKKKAAAIFMVTDPLTEVLLNSTYMSFYLN